MHPRWPRLHTAPILRAGLTWFGAATLGWTVALAVELVLRARPTEAIGAAVYTASLGCLAAVRWSVAVVAVHAVLRVVRDRRARWLGAAWIALGACTLPMANELARNLVSGDWIAEQSYAPLLRWALCAALVVGWMHLWLWHAWGASSALRQRLVSPARRTLRLATDASWWLLGLSALPLVTVVLAGPLRPYPALAAGLLAPAWLVAGTLAFRCLWRFPRVGTALAVVALVLATAALPLRASQSRRVAEVRSRAMGTTIWIAGTEDVVRTGPPPRLGRFDFARVDDRACPKPRRLPSLPLTAAQRRHVILLSIDTVRRDAIGKRYAGRPVTPNLEAFGRDGIEFVRAASPAPITLYAIGSLLTGHSVSQLLYLPAVPPNVFALTRRVFDRRHIVLPKWPVLQRRRFTSLAIQKAPVAYVSRTIDPSGAFLAELGQARDAGERVFAWLHLVEPHHPYAAHPGFDFGPEPVQRYHGEIAYDDAIVGRVLTGLRAKGWFEDSLVVIFSDHGEIIGEQGYFGHGISMVGRLTEVPLYVRAPGTAPRRSLAPVTLTDLAPTVLHYLDLPIPAAMSGTSLLASDAELARRPWPASTTYGIGTADFDRVLAAPMRKHADLARRQRQIARWARLPPELAVTSTTHRYLLDLKTGFERLFDRARDPLDRNNLAFDAPERVREFRARVEAWSRDEAHRIACMIER
jgi:hypothetical protein